MLKQKIYRITAVLISLCIVFSGCEKEEKPQETGAIYGKPFKGKPVSMQELSLDMGTVIIEGKVFNIEHKELTKRNAWVINFDMTDNTSSVRVSRFLENKEAKPILDGVKVGSVIQVQGKPLVDNFTNETVLKPFAIMPGSSGLSPRSASRDAAFLENSLYLSSSPVISARMCGSPARSIRSMSESAPIVVFL